MKNTLKDPQKYLYEIPETRATIQDSNVINYVEGSSTRVGCCSNQDKCLIF